MCLYIHKKHPKEKTAKGDFYVTKTGLSCTDNAFKSIVKVYVYLVNLRQPTIKLIPVEHTMHNRKIRTIKARAVIYKGYHSFKIKKKHRERLIEGLFVIPKGAKYYFNSEWDEYVSSTLIYIRPYN